MRLIFSMQPTGGYYYGQHFLDNSGAPFPNSDMVFKAILSTWEILYGKESQKELIAAFNKDASNVPFTHTSIFPKIGDTYFLPCPINFTWHPQFSRYQAKWISTNLYQEYLETGQLSQESIAFISPGLIYHADKDAASKSVNLAWESELRLRNYNEADHIVSYPSKVIHYHRDLKTYIIFEVEESYLNKLKSCWRLLADSGIGGKRSIGCGTFRDQGCVEAKQHIPFIDNAVEKSWINLSLYYSEQNTILSDAFYNFTLKHSWGKNVQGGSEALPPLRMLKEGSLFHQVPTTTPPLFLLQPPDMEQAFYYIHPFPLVARGEEACT